MTSQKRKILLVANWKCNPATLPEAQRLFAAIKKTVPRYNNIDVVICPPAVFLSRFSAVGGKLGVQDVFWENTGAYTGAIGSRMARSVGASYAIIGHSERREHMGETNEMVQAKVKAALAAGLRVVLCVGEKSRDGDAAAYAGFVKEEVSVGLRGVTKQSLGNVIIAYEPIWAVGSDEADTPERTLEMALYIRKTIADLYDRTVAQTFPVLYGGSANAGNARAFLRDGGVDGLLVGRASLQAKEFGKIVQIANEF
ncbi:MAG: triose-phosphate isomerase [Candidatus Ryanbacteria bacterium RIFCSPHIGHO2_02_FULL_45_17b]|uniref:Triosephosphate isomerase n=1 Tax=Candidatus Ryanbacteria bacterium RIFCSPHIGHO2_01_FULL_45_22 TaxID=1802114 RepID=A0A1G2G2S2_9BACT|nr:MAG: triose-phosphate isomerase [Candidatus Ryanbacteria bacterium RIFCSPHIGHO2_01_FULL_45_22]OGZ46469.1 MAG: triose-phosphate isomerase [Candidatus Ryanbacteria bacterium RIFCSPHIGHO2_02_FULL_45_17b]